MRRRQAARVLVGPTVGGERRRGSLRDRTLTPMHRYPAIDSKRAEARIRRWSVCAKVDRATVSPARVVPTSNPPHGRALGTTN